MLERNQGGVWRSPEEEERIRQENLRGKSGRRVIDSPGTGLKKPPRSDRGGKGRNWAEEKWQQISGA